MAGDAPLLEDELYKQTVAFDYVVKRYVKLYSNRLETYADKGVPEDHRTFFLDDTDRLQPDRKDAIQHKKRYLRPPGVGSMTALAAVRGKGAQLELWGFKLKREEHSDFCFCFQDQAQAYRWYDAMAQVISDLRVKAGKGPLPPGSFTPHTASDEAIDSLAALPPASFYSCARKGPEDSAMHVHSTNGGGGGGGGLQSEDSVMGLPMQSSRQHEEEEEECLRLINSNLPAGSTTRFQQRWVPYRHSNGLAIYQHYNKAQGLAPEYMVSAVIRGSPRKVLRVLVDPYSTTTILGPAMEVEVLDSVPGKQTLRIVLQAEGSNAAWFRPREAILQRVLKAEEDGVYVVLFSSVDTAMAHSLPSEGVIEVAEGLDDRACRSNPIRCKVSGGYTISKLGGFGASNSPETLLTCVLQVSDMGGWLNPPHPLFRVVNWWSGGAYEAFVERMLLGVMMVRDKVEQSRFAVQPQLFTSRGESEAGAGQQGYALRSTSLVLRRAAAADGLLGLRRISSPALSPAAPGPLRPGGPSSPFEAGSVKPMHSQLSMVQQQQQQQVKMSRLASQRLGSGAAVALRSRTPTRSLQGALAQQDQQQQQQQEEEAKEEAWGDASFQLPDKFYEEIHTPGHDAPFKVRGGSYLRDGVKVAPAGLPTFELLGMEAINTGTAETMPHISRFLPCVRRSSKPFLFVWNLMVPGPPTICCVFVFGADRHPDSLGAPSDDPEDSDWQPFDHLMWRFLHGDDDERCSLFKMIPRIAEGSWVVKQSVGTTPVIVGRKLATSFYITRKYVEVDVDVGSSATAQYITGMVRGGCKSLVLDLGLVLEGQQPWELPEVLLGAVRVKRLDLSAASMLDSSKEIPILDVASAPADSGASSTTVAPVVSAATAAL